MREQTPYPELLIKVDRPIQRISEHARRDQNIRKARLHTMHGWWATRPLASCRAVIMATLLPDPHCPPQFAQEARRLMRDWAARHLGRASAESLPRPVAVQKNPAGLDDPAELRRALLDFIADFAAWEAGVDEAYLRTARARWSRPPTRTDRRRCRPTFRRLLCGRIACARVVPAWRFRRWSGVVRRLG